MGKFKDYIMKKSLEILWDQAKTVYEEVKNDFSKYSDMFTEGGKVLKQSLKKKKTKEEVKPGSTTGS